MFWKLVLLLSSDVEDMRPIGSLNTGTCEQHSEIGLPKDLKNSRNLVQNSSPEGSNNKGLCIILYTWRQDIPNIYCVVVLT
jgi:hypothetical protein